MASIDVTVTTAPITVTVDDGTTVTVGAGTVGPAGAQGPAGTNGQGVPTGGTTGQVLAKKTGTNYDTEWVDQSGGGGGGSGTVTEVTGTAPISVATGTTTPVVSIAAATTSAAGSMSAADKAKIDGVASGATANATNAQLRDRSTHTGTQALSTISDAGTAAAKNAPAAGNASATEVVLGSDTRLTDARTPSTHAASHGTAGSDPITVAQSQVTNLTTDLAGKVPTTRTVNGQALSSDITITATLADGDVTTAKIADGAVTSAKIADGTIVDADISASAAIATSKISGLTTVATDTIFDAVGDLAVGTGADASARLAKGSRTQALVVGASTLEYDANHYSGGNFLTDTVSGAIAETMPGASTFASVNVGSSGTAHLHGIYLPKGVTVSNITVVSGGTAANGPTNQWFALCNSSRTVLRVTVNDTTTAWAASTAKTLALTSSFTTTYSGLHYIAVCVTATTAVPNFRGISVGTVTGINQQSFTSTTGLTTPVAEGTTFAASTGRTGIVMGVLS